MMIVPTGVGASIGGYAGDALPVARALSSVVDCLISHPNVSLFLSISASVSRGLYLFVFLHVLISVVFIQILSSAQHFLNF